MKNQINFFLVIACIFAIVYLIGAFATASFDLKSWSMEARTVCSFMITVGIIMFMGTKKDL